MNNTVKIAGVDVDFTKAVIKANKGESIIIPSNENGNPILSCWNIPRSSEARKQLREIARKSGMPDCQKADRQDNLYRPCPFQRDRQGDDGGQNQAYAP